MKAIPITDAMQVQYVIQMLFIYNKTFVKF